MGASSCSSATDRDSVREHGAQRGVLLRCVDAEEGVQDGVVVVLDGFLHEESQGPEQAEHGIRHKHRQCQRQRRCAPPRAGKGWPEPSFRSFAVECEQSDHGAHVAHSLARKFAHE